MGTIAGKYRKTHFAQGYRNGQNKGDNPPGYLRGTEYPVFGLGEHRIGIMICYDRQEPVVAQRLAQNGAELILIPSYGMMGDCNREFLAARAKENGVPILFVHPDQTVFSDARGEIRMDVRPRADESRLALVSIEVATRR
jgi:predicted amidohydrolase